MFDARGNQGRERHHPRQGAAGTKKKERANKPNEFVTNDDFCPGCGLELKSLPGDSMFLYADIFRATSPTPPIPANAEGRRQARPVRVPRLGLDSWLGAERRRYIDELRDDIKAREKAMPPKYAYVHGVADARSRPTMQRRHARQSR